MDTSDDAYAQSGGRRPFGIQACGLLVVVTMVMVIGSRVVCVMAMAVVVGLGERR